MEESGKLSLEEQIKGLDKKIKEDKTKLDKYTKFKKLTKKLIIIIPVVYGIGVLAPYFLTEVNVILWHELTNYRICFVLKGFLLKQA